jgi:hypothetical protein
MLSGKHPDELRLFSMMYSDKSFTISGDVEMLSQTAQVNGYKTGFVTNLGRWYRRGVDVFVDSRGWPGVQIFQSAAAVIESFEGKPWFVIVHTDDCHMNYTGGSYSSACRSADSNIRKLIELVGDDTAVFITSDHGEGLGQSGLDGKPIQQHGYGLWDFLTHVPLLTNTMPRGECICLHDVGCLYSRMLRFITGHSSLTAREVVYRGLVFQSGATPKAFHRGVVLGDGRQFVRGTTEKGHEYYWVGDFTDEERKETELQVSLHCQKYGRNYGVFEDDAVAMRKLKGLGYFE